MPAIGLPYLHFGDSLFRGPV